MHDILIALAFAAFVACPAILAYMPLAKVKHAG